MVEKVYKYREFNDRTKEILKSGEFFFGDWKKMNDPMEGFFEYYSEEHSDAEIENLKNGKNKYGICCFSEYSNIFLQWSHYADEHKGICIEIEIDTNLCNENNIEIETIKYKSNIPKLFNLKNKRNISKKLLTRKTILWNYEKEVRAFCSGINNKYKIGRITKVFVGLRCSQDDREFISSIVNKDIIRDVKIDFDTNTIEEKA